MDAPGVFTPSEQVRAVPSSGSPSCSSLDVQVDPLTELDDRRSSFRRVHGLIVDYLIPNPQKKGGDVFMATKKAPAKKAKKTTKKK